MMRLSPCEEPSWCPCENCSSPRTRRPRRARWNSVALPIAPSPTTMASYPCGCFERCSLCRCLSFATVVTFIELIPGVRALLPPTSSDVETLYLRPRTYHLAPPTFTQFVVAVCRSTGETPLGTIRTVPDEANQNSLSRSSWILTLPIL